MFNRDVGAYVQVLLCCSCLIDALFSYSYNAAAADDDDGCHGDGDDAVRVSCVYQFTDILPVL